MAYKTRKSNKYGAKKTVYDGYKYDSKFEAAVAEDLTLEKRAGNILDFDRQFRLDIYAYSQCGTRKMKKSHKVDFRVHNLDGTFTLLEAKGFETREWREIVKWIDNFFLPLNPDYEYVVEYQKKRTWRPRCST